MAKYETEIYADFDHFLQYMENSLNFGTAVPVNVADYTADETTVCIRRFDVTAPVRFLTVAGKKGKNKLTVEILETGVFFSKGIMEDSGKNFAPSMQKIIDAYIPGAPEEKNSYYRHQYQKNIPEQHKEYNSPEIPGLFEKIKNLFKN